MPVLQHFIPASGADQARRGRGLGWLGPSWRQAPVRRLTQAASLLLFLYLFFYVAWPFAGTFLPTALEDKEWLPVEVYLWLDPLAGFSTALAARHWNVALWGMGGVLLICMLFPRGFCGYLCPLGTSIDAADWLAGKFRRGRKGVGEKWRGLRYGVLLTVLTASAFGVLIAGYLAAIPVLTRGLMFTAGRWQFGALRGWSQIAGAGGALYFSVALFALIFLLALAGRRFWCRYLCPSGALFSVASLLRLTERKVKATCTACGQCAEACSFGAIAPDFTTRPLECTYCQTCGGACPASAIEFGWRWSRDAEPAKASEAPEGCAGLPVSRRTALASTAGSLAALNAGLLAALGTRLTARPERRLLRPPGSVPEDEFLDLCIRCGECFKVCPGPILQPAGLEAGLEALWTPVAVPVKAGCHQDCNLCTQICPTRAIRPLALDEKRRTHMGLVKVNTKTCLPFAGERDCRLCFDECEAAGYHAIEMREIKLELDLSDIPPGAVSDDALEEMGRIQAPFVDPRKCVGCGLCEYRCHAANVKQQQFLAASAIVTVAENEDRRF